MATWNLDKTKMGNYKTYNRHISWEYKVWNINLNIKIYEQLEIYQENCRKYRMTSLLKVPSVGQWSFLLFWVVMNAEMRYCSVCGKRAIVCLRQRGNMFVIPNTWKKARKERESCKLGRRAMKCCPHNLNMPPWLHTWTPNGWG